MVYLLTYWFSLQGIITTKPCDPYINISDILSLIPKKIIPSLSRYFIANVNPSSYKSKFFIEFPNIVPIIIDIIIGEMGLLLRFSIEIPM